MAAYCKDCGVKLSDSRSKRCMACESKRRASDPVLCARVAEMGRKVSAARKKPPRHCLDCGKEVTRKAKRCRPCAYQIRSKDPEWRRNISKAAKQRFQNEDRRSQVSSWIKEAWERGAYDSEESRRRRGNATRASWQNPESRKRRIKALKERWKDPDYHARMVEVSTKVWTRKKREEKSISSMGANNPNWNGGSSFEPYPPAFNASLKREIRNRDNYICAICSVHEKEQAHDVHHIDYDKTNNHADNLITLCHICHPVTNGDRPSWQARLEQLMEEK